MGEDTVEIYTLWNRLKARFNITKSQPKSFILGETVIPVTSVDIVLGAPILYYGDKTIAANGHHWLATVPTGKRWKVSLSYVNTAGAGTFDVNQFEMTDGGAALPYDIFTDTTEHHLFHPHPLVITAGMQLGVVISNFAVGGDMSWRYWVTETDIEE